MISTHWAQEVSGYSRHFDCGNFVILNRELDIVPHLGRADCTHNSSLALWPALTWLNKGQHQHPDTGVTVITIMSHRNITVIHLQITLTLALLGPGQPSIDPTPNNDNNFFHQMKKKVPYFNRIVSYGSVDILLHSLTVVCADGPGSELDLRCQPI